MSTLVSIRDIAKTYYDPTEVPVLRGISLEIMPSDTIAITGPSGSGKSTLLNIVGTLDLPTAGEVLFEGRSLRTLSAGQAAAFRNTRIGLVFQQHHLLPQLNVLENVLLPLVPQGRRAVREARSRALSLLERVGLADRSQYKPSRLSGGERQRVAVVRALLPQPKLILADEPTGSLDADTAAALTELMVELNHEMQTTLVTVTHAEALARKMHRRYRLLHGKLQEQ